MKPPVFDYATPATLAEATALLVQYEGEAKVLSGGQSLVPLLNMRLAQPQVVIDISKVEALTATSVDDGQVRYGAATVHRRFEDGDVYCGLYADVLEPGRVAVGDTVEPAGVAA